MGNEGKTDKLVALWGLVDDYIDTYELRADDGDYMPTKTERILLRDAFYGLIDDEGFIQKWDAWRAAVNKSKKETTP